MRRKWRKRSWLIKCNDKELKILRKAVKDLEKKTRDQLYNQGQPATDSTGEIFSLGYLADVIKIARALDVGRSQPIIGKDVSRK